MSPPHRKPSLAHLLVLLTVGAVVPTLAVPTTAAPFILAGVYSGGAGPPDPAFQFSISGALPGAPVRISFASCRLFWLAAVQPMPPGSPAIVVDCLDHSATTTASPAGVATFRIVASSENPGGMALPATVGPCAEVTSGATSLGAYYVATMDQDNASGAGSADLGAIIGDVLYCVAHPGAYFSRSDIEGDLDTDSADMGKWIDIFIYTLVVNQTNGSSCGDLANCCSLLN